MIEESIEMARKHLSDPNHRWNVLTMREDLERVLNDIEILFLSNYIEEAEPVLTGCSVGTENEL